LLQFLGNDVLIGYSSSVVTIPGLLVSGPISSGTFYTGLTGFGNVNATVLNNGQVQCKNFENTGTYTVGSNLHVPISNVGNLHAFETSKADRFVCHYSSLPAFASTDIGYIHHTQWPVGLQSGNISISVTVPVGIYMLCGFGFCNSGPQAAVTFIEMVVAGGVVGYSMPPDWAGNQYQYLTPICVPYSFSNASTVVSLIYQNITTLSSIGGTGLKAIRIA